MAEGLIGFRQQVGGLTSFTDFSATTGKSFFVSSTTGSSTNTGRTPDNALATLNQAVAYCTANKGDRIYLMPGHAETLVAASGADLTVAGVAVFGIGEGDSRPTFTMGTATTASFDFSAADCRISNIRFVNNIDSLAAFIIGGAGNAVIEKCDFITSSTKEALSAITIPTTYDNWVIDGCRFIQPTDPAGSNAAAGTGAIYLVDSENVEIKNCEFRGNWETAFIHNKTTAAANLWVMNCRGICSLADAIPFLLVSTATGGAIGCSFIVPASTDVVEATTSGTFGAGFFNFESYFGNDGGGGQLAVAVQSAAS